MQGFFKFSEHGTTYSKEIIGGLTTFVTTAYIIIVNPAILEAAGIPKGPSMVATILIAAVGTLLMGIYAKRPFAIAPYMGENAFVAYTVCGVLHYSWQTALGAIFIGGVLFTVLTITGLRRFLAESIPMGLKCSFSVGIGLFLTFIGLNECGIVKLGVPGAPVAFGNIDSAKVLIAIFGIILIAILLIRKVPGGMFLGIIVTALLAFIFRSAPLPNSLISMPPSMGPIFLKLDIGGALTWGFFSVVLTVFVMDFVDTMGTLIGVSSLVGWLDKDGNLPEIEKPMLVDAVSTIIGALFGTTTAGTYIESAAGIEAGARTGFASVVTGLLFLLALFFAPFLTAIPPEAYGPALVIVGFIMLRPVAEIKLSDYTELFPAAVTIAFMSFTFNIGIGFTAGFILYPLFKLITGRARETKPGMYVLAILSLLFYIFYPYSK
ncbi:MAG: guanine permease [candidate division Zixibacteria bacterium CG_4_9_14_3_um_filter_46_8]|nr:MAG: guanine permease [candidate division Zixibacteria bacterium CG_4_9_14_3_um_filter_46_8]